MISISPPISLCPPFPHTWDMLVGFWLVPQWTDSGRSGALGAIARWPVPMALSRGPGSARQPPMGDLSVAVTGQKAESAIILTAQVKFSLLWCLDQKLRIEMVGKKETNRNPRLPLSSLSWSRLPSSLPSASNHTWHLVCWDGSIQCQAVWKTQSHVVSMKINSLDHILSIGFVKSS